QKPTSGRTTFQGADHYLEGQQGAYIETRNGFDVDGVEIKCRLDFGAKAIDWRGLYKNPSA
uniref:phage major capsid protein n=1 Tax=Paracoccus aeridis TaxID=1966466 RepID=UPI0010AA5769